MSAMSPLKSWRSAGDGARPRGDMPVVRYADDIIVGFEHETDARRFQDAGRGCRSSRCRSIRTRRACSSSAAMWRPGAPQARARQTGVLQPPGLQLRLRQEPSGPLPGRTEDPPRPHASQAQGDQGGAATAAAPADSRAGEVAAAGSWPASLPTMRCRPTAGPWGRSATTSRIYGGARFGDAAKRIERRGSG